jgi:hypothetical protein
LTGGGEFDKTVVVLIIIARRNLNANPNSGYQRGCD